LGKKEELPGEGRRSQKEAICGTPAKAFVRFGEKQLTAGWEWGKMFAGKKKKKVKDRTYKKAGVEQIHDLRSKKRPSAGGGGNPPKVLLEGP